MLVEGIKDFKDAFRSPATYWLFRMTCIEKRYKFVICRWCCPLVWEEFQYKKFLESCWWGWNEHKLCVYKVLSFLSFFAPFSTQSLLFLLYFSGCCKTATQCDHKFHGPMLRWCDGSLHHTSVKVAYWTHHWRTVVQVYWHSEPDCLAVSTRFMFSQFLTPSHPHLPASPGSFSTLDTEIDFFLFHFRL